MAEADPAPRAPARDTPERDRAALLIIDMVNRFDFSGGDRLRDKAVAIAGPIRALRERFDAAGWPVLYINDNFGEWHSEKGRLVEQALGDAPDALQALAPRPDDYFVIKPQFSGFYATNLPVLLPKLGVRRLALTGLATDICVLFTAGDAHMRDYALWVPADTVAAEDQARGDWALAIMRESMGAETRDSDAMTPQAWVAATRD